MILHLGYIIFAFGVNEAVLVELRKLGVFPLKLSLDFLCHPKLTLSLKPICRHNLSVQQRCAELDFYTFTTVFTLVVWKANAKGSSSGFEIVPPSKCGDAINICL